jgi:uncharacterized membrane protein YgdD (TMEM256/DUF423 family)
VKFSTRLFVTCAAFLGLTGIIFAALGSHIVDMQAVKNGAAIWQTASIIHLFQASALLGFSLWLNSLNSRQLVWACALMLTGTLVFCGSLYIRVVSAGEISGAAPVGGVIMMLGWLLAGILFWRNPE